jgi:putative hydrolase of the HAD superfamily
MLQCLIFDMDDTLYDEIDYCRSGFKVVAHAIAAMEALTARPAVSSTEIFNFIWQQFTSGHRQNLFNITLDSFYLPYNNDTIADLVEIYRNHRPIITLNPADAAILSQLKQNYKLGLLSDGFLPAQQYKAEALGLNQYFDAIVFTESLGRQYWKPSPLGYQQILQQLDIKTQNWAYIADNATSRCCFHPVTTP